LNTAAIIVAAGRGLRAGGGIPKQYRQLDGEAVLLRSIRAFSTHPDIARVVVVLNPDDLDLYQARVSSGLGDACVEVVHGGAERALSVKAGLRALAGTGTQTVLIHDGARPLVSNALISSVLEATQQRGAAAPALALSDTIWRTKGGAVQGILDRTTLVGAQTPQGFLLDKILAAHEQSDGTQTDDVSVALAAGLDVHIVPGQVDNLKITEAGDFKRAEALLRGGPELGPEFRMGNGFDVHAFCTGDHVVLCGVSIPHERGLAGHSDADVAMHAITDAIYGAAGLGDIGRWFPPSDEKWRGAASDIFLDHAVKTVREAGFEIMNTDCTIICETPKITPHAPAMRARLAGIMSIDPTRISVKATTSERLGFTGRGEGIATMATATLRKK